MITYHKGDLFEQSNGSPIAHGVNCQGKMGSGFAKQLRKKYPWSYKEYINYCQNGGIPENLLGRVGMSCQDGQCIFHCFTQLEYGKRKNRYVSYDAVDSCMAYLCKIDIPCLSIPKIGSGLGGAEWSIVESIIKFHLDKVNVHVYEL